MHHKINFTEPDQETRMKGVWMTDIHLDAAHPDKIPIFFNQIKELEPDFLLIGGDIYNGMNGLKLLRQLVQTVGKPSYFVLGNHDFYYGSISQIRELAQRLAGEVPEIHYLTREGIYELTPTMALLGHDGWSDGREGDFLRSNVVLNDYILIDELKHLSPKSRLKVLHDLGTEAADNLREKLEVALKKYSRVLVLTHSPPFREACLYDNKVSDSNWSPHFVCKVMGDTLMEFAQSHPDKELLVLSGHSHHAADIHPTPNLRVIAGQSEYGSPTFQGTLEI